MFFRRKTKDERRKSIVGEGLPLARTSLLATPSSRGSNAAPATPRFMHTSLVSLFLMLAFALTPTASFAQQNVTVDAVKKRAELNSAKADLEEARRKRDMAVAARWKDRETFNKERELFNDKYQLGKERVDALMSERTRLLEDVSTRCASGSPRSRAGGLPSCAGRERWKP